MSIVVYGLHTTDRNVNNNQQELGTRKKHDFSYLNYSEEYRKDIAVKNHGYINGPDHAAYESQRERKSLV